MLLLETFDRLLDAITIETDELATLARRRAEHVAEALQTQFEVKPAQTRVMETRPGGPTIRKGDPRVTYEIITLD